MLKCVASVKVYRTMQAHSHSDWNRTILMCFFKNTLQRPYNYFHKFSYNNLFVMPAQDVFLGQFLLAYVVTDF